MSGAPVAKCPTARESPRLVRILEQTWTGCESQLKRATLVGLDEPAVVKAHNMLRGVSVEPARRIVAAYGWDRLLYEILVAVLSNHGWRAVGSQTEMAESGDVSLVLVHCSRPTAGVIENVQRASTAYPSAKIVVVGGDLADTDLLRFIESGVSAYIGAHQSVTDLLDAMEMVRESRTPSCGRITRQVLAKISRLTQQSYSQSHPQLTLRQEEILRLIAKGLSNKEIAASLSITPNTVKNHVHNLLDKLNLRSRHQAAWVELRSLTPVTKSQIA